MVYYNNLLQKGLRHETHQKILISNLIILQDDNP